MVYKQGEVTTITVIFEAIYRIVAIIKFNTTVNHFNVCFNGIHAMLVSLK